MLGNLKTKLQNAWVGPPRTLAAESPGEAELDHIVFLAKGALQRARSAIDYRVSADSCRRDLDSARVELERALSADPKFKSRTSKAVAHLVLAQIYTELGQFDRATINYGTIAFLPGSDHPLSFNAIWMSLCRYSEPCQVDIILNYLAFLTGSGRNLGTAESMCRELLQGSQDALWSTNEHYTVMVYLIRILNLNGRCEEAFANLKSLDALSTDTPVPYHTSTAVVLARATTLGGLQQNLEAENEFVTAIVLRAVAVGMWHATTLDAMYEYGKFLKNSGRHPDAVVVLGECCLGRFYRLGALHPDSTRALATLTTRDDPVPYLSLLKVVSSPDSDEVSGRSIAYEHTYLRTIADLFKDMTDADQFYCSAAVSLQALLDSDDILRVETPEHQTTYICRIRRTLARCLSEQGQAEQALAVLEETDSRYKRSKEGALQSDLDRFRFRLRVGINPSESAQLKRRILFDAAVGLNHEQADAFHRMLVKIDSAHFPYEPGSNTSFPIRVMETVGTGAYAIVESVEIANRVYARKSIAIPRYNQKRVRETIQNEISVIRSLDNPHIVQVYFTYEEKSRFAIVLQPLADCDLEAFLEQPTDSTLDKTTLFQKWLCCLANTLAFIHSKGIRHKDIKTRNILVKDNDIIFADFGSSHAFLDEGTSVTEGPAFGHTLMYCAPEVVSWEKRSRSADVFSLGCVFTELLTWVEGSQISDYFEFRMKETGGTGGGETHAYNATLDLVDEWFNKPESCRKFGDWNFDMKYLYETLIKPMLSTSLEARPTAVQEGVEIKEIFENSLGGDLPVCRKCYQP
jgi:serine/threonine protein kinase/predicted negative regulator of RcsB-dependent stress response